MFVFVSACKGQPADSTVVIDSLRITDSVHIVFEDSVNIIPVDSVNTRDSVNIFIIEYRTEVRDSFNVQDSIVYIIRDSVVYVIRDSIAIRDSIVTRDTTIYIDDDQHVKNPTVPDTLSVGIQSDINNMLVKMKTELHITEDPWIDDIIIIPIISEDLFMIRIIDVNENIWDFFLPYEPNDFVR